MESFISVLYSLQYNDERKKVDIKLVTMATQMELFLTFIKRQKCTGFLLLK